MPRSVKYRLVGDTVRQYESVRPDSEKIFLISNRKQDKHVVRKNFGQGQPYYTSLIAKLLTIIANKAASFDPEGIGLEMEADRPDWYDALNGLPALFGSSLSETLELKRLAAYVDQHLTEKVKIDLPVEVKDYIAKIGQQLSETADPFTYWDNTYSIKEAFRQQVRLGISGEEASINGQSAGEFLTRVIARCDQGIKKCLKRYKNYHTYFINEVADFEVDKNSRVTVRKFQQKVLPLFLEGFVHALKVEKDNDIYRLVKQSPLYDKKLKMYKVNAPLADTPIEIGRARIFTPGWLENESIWLHMEYKYMLELLKAGLHKEFFADFKNVLIPFADPKQYKRSIMENSSFICSSAHPNARNHGRGFVARLSGASAEFIDMWLIMTTGKRIFSLDNKGKLVFKLAPVLPAWLFNKGRFSFTLLGRIPVTYINETKKNTYDGLAPVSYKLVLDDKEVEINKPVIAEPYAKLIRDRKVKEIIVKLG